MIRWVFLDVGNVLLDEDPLTFVCFLRHVEAVCRARPELSFDHLLAEYEARAAAGARWPLHEIVSPILDHATSTAVWNETDRELRSRFDELSPVVPHAEALVDRLANRYRLGLIANQGRECRARLNAVRLLDRFDVIAFSEERGAYKPDSALFELALRESGAAPAECLMVGDRLDNDTAPAARLGLRTAWIRWPRRTAKGWAPADPRAIAYRDSLERISARAADRYHDFRPTITVDTIGELALAIERSGR
jgi:HAD superfamily hydrolase (TIGR01549 family)